MRFLDATPQSSSAGVAYRRLGRGPTVLLLHGIPGGASSWFGVADLLADEHDVVVPDLLGFGASARHVSIEQLHVDGQSDVLEKLIDEAALGSVTVVGHDFGGPVAVQLAARAPQSVNGIGLLATNVFADTPIPFPLSTVTWPVLGTVSRRMLFAPLSLRMMLRQGVGPDSGPIDVTSHIGDRRQQRAIASIFAESLVHLEDRYRPIEAALPGLAVPRFVGWGDHDPFFDVAQGRRVASALGVGLQLLKGAGHFLPHERPEEIARLVRALIVRVRSDNPVRARNLASIDVGREANPPVDRRPARGQRRRSRSPFEDVLTMCWIIRTADGPEGHCRRERHGHHRRGHRRRSRTGPTGRVVDQTRG